MSSKSPRSRTRRFQNPPSNADITLHNLPTDSPVAVYYRQSTVAQVGNISTQIQTVDMVEEMRRRGWAEDSIILIDMDAGVSGTTKIDEREGMRQLFGLITGGHIAAVACQDEDRLFRDVTQIQVNIFIDACARYADASQGHNEQALADPLFRAPSDNPACTPNGYHSGTRYRFVVQVARSPLSFAPPDQFVNSCQKAIDIKLDRC